MYSILGDDGGRCGYTVFTLTSKYQLIEVNNRIFEDKMENKTKRNGIKPHKSVVFSYILVGLLSLLCAVVIFFTSYRIIYSKTQEAFGEVLKTVCSAFDSELDTIRSTANEITSSDTITNALYNIENRSSNKVASINKNVCDVLKEYCERDDAISSIYLFRFRDDKVLASECCTSGHTYFDMRYHTGYSIEYSTWHDMLCDYYMGVTEKVIYKNDGQRVVFFMRSLPVAGTVEKSDSRATLVIEMDESYISGYFEKLSLEPSLIFEIETSNGECFTYTKVDTKDLERKTTLYCESSNSEWQYRLLVPSYMLVRSMRPLIWISLVSILILELLNFILIPRFVEKFFGPMNRMITNVSKRLGMSSKECDMVFVQNQFERLFSEHSSALKSIDTMREIMGKADVINLLLGIRVPPMSKYESKPSMVVVIALKNKNEMTEEEVIQLNNDMLGENGFLDGIGVRLDGKAVFLLDCSNMNEEDRDVNIELIQERLDSSRYIFSASRIYTTDENVSNGYREAMWQVQYALLPKVNYDGENELQVMENGFLPDCECLINQIIGHETASAQETLHDIFEDNRDCCITVPDLSHIMASRILSELYHICSSRFPGFESDIVSTWSACLDEKDYDKILELVSELVRRICSREGNVISARETMKQSVLEYIEQHYVDCNLSIETIAAAFGRSSATISRAFHESGTDSPVNKEIAKIRIEAACRLINENRQMTIAEVCSATGYYSVATFMRHFKQQTGVSPGRYRAMCEGR